jgi:hypothetical protein
MEAGMAEPRKHVDLDQVRRLTHEICDGVVSQEGLDELSALLASSEQAAQEYWSILGIHEELHWDLAGENGRLPFLAEQLSAYAEFTGDAQTDRRPAGRIAWRYLAIAASLLVAALSVLLVSQHFEGQLNLRAAVEKAEHRLQDKVILGSLKSLVPLSRWSVGRPGGNNVGSLQQGDTIYLDAGAAELRFTTNTVAVLESPLVMQLVAVDRVRVIRGSIKVAVAKGAEGFSVETASAEVIDLGTEFAVNVEDGDTDVVVFDGEVDLKVAAVGHSRDAEPVSKRFRAGEAVHVTDDGTLSRIVDVRRSKFDRAGQALRPPVIAEVKDNYVRDDFWSFYEIVPGGMGEDQRCYVDRPHEWNGMNASGMPAYLVGADYVKTFCNDKVTKDLRIDVTLSHAATLYVLFDKRASPPKWLTDAFQPTGDEIGVDEQDFDVWQGVATGPRDLAVGPGNSINRQFSIWRKVVDRPGTVTLGANGLPILVSNEPLDLNAEMAMYGIVAAPLRVKPAATN